mgnify:CR=1 FL=1|tara:strand:- start:102 stop:389 length:288 start_codon:yes stop_codon:yes gene_type:complete
MAKGGRPDKQHQVMGMFSKIAREADRLKKRQIREAKKRGEFIYLDHPELLSIPEQVKYFEAMSKHEKGNGMWTKVYNRESSSFPFPYKFMNAKDK